MMQRKDASRVQGQLKSFQLAIIAFLAVATTATADDPWIISGPVVMTEATRVGDVIIVDGGSLHVSGVPEPGLEVEGNLWTVGSGDLVLSDSVISFLSTHHGQYALAVAERATARVSGCDYRVPAGVQHALLTAGDAVLDIADSTFGDVQLVAAENSRLSAVRLDGHFEVIVMHDASMVLEDIPRSPDGGNLWVWPEFPAGSDAVYTPPMPGFVEEWSFPPPGSSGIAQSVDLERCQVLLWPMLVRADSRLTLRDVPEDNWIVVGLHMPTSATVRQLDNGMSAALAVVDLDDRVLTLDHASVDTWNLYPEGRARVVVLDSHVGEILALDRSTVIMESTLVDGTGGFFGARDSSLIVARQCTFTCTVEATDDSTIRLHHSLARPYPTDPTGAFTRFGAYERARLLADHTPIETTPAVGGDGLIAVTWIGNPPPTPPPPGVSVTLTGSAALFSLEGGPAPGRWRLETKRRWATRPRVLASGAGNVEASTLGVWEGADPSADYELRIVLTDSWGRSLTGNARVLGGSIPAYPSPSPDDAVTVTRE